MKHVDDSLVSRLVDGKPKIDTGNFLELFQGVLLLVRYILDQALGAIRSALCCELIGELPQLGNRLCALLRWGLLRLGQRASRDFLRDEIAIARAVSLQGREERFAIVGKGCRLQVRGATQRPVKVL